MKINNFFFILAALKEQEAALAMLKGRRSSTNSKSDSGIVAISDSSSPLSADKQEIARYRTSK